MQVPQRPAVHAGLRPSLACGMLDTVPAAALLLCSELSSQTLVQEGRKAPLTPLPYIFTRLPKSGFGTSQDRCPGDHPQTHRQRMSVILLASRFEANCETLRLSPASDNPCSELPCS